MQPWLDKRRIELEDRLRDLRDRVGRIEAHRVRVGAGGDSSDLVDQAQRHEDDDVVETLATRASEDVPALEDALRRIDEGSYGVCAMCAAPIAWARLELLPATRLCASCARERVSAT